MKSAQLSFLPAAFDVARPYQGPSCQSEWITPAVEKNVGDSPTTQTGWN